MGLVRQRAVLGQRDGLVPDAVELTVDAAWFYRGRWGQAPSRGCWRSPRPTGMQSDGRPSCRSQTAELARPACGDRWAGRPGCATGSRSSAIPSGGWNCGMWAARLAAGDLLRGVVARRGERTVVALRNASWSPSRVDIDDLHAGAVVTVGLQVARPRGSTSSHCRLGPGPAPTNNCARVPSCPDVMDYLGIPDSARSLVQAVFAGHEATSRWWPASVATPGSRPPRSALP